VSRYRAWGRCAGWAALAGCVALHPATAQDSVPPGPRGPAAFAANVWRGLSDSSRAGWVRPLASLVAPGTGQLLAGDERGALYMVAEAFLLTRFVSQQREGDRSGSQFRDLAFQVARGPYSPTTRDTLFEYFEQMGRYIESGPFDRDPGPAFAPATDTLTYNGSIWELARRTFFANPDSTPSIDSEAYQRALEFYRRRAIGANFQWSWRNASLERDLFRQTIRNSDDAFRTAQQELGLLLANHLLSAIDAVVSRRLSRGGRRTEVGSVIWWPPGAASPGVGVHVRIGF
jgi:hypothetical protein